MRNMKIRNFSLISVMVKICVSFVFACINMVDSDNGNSGVVSWSNNLYDGVNEECIKLRNFP